MILEVTAVSLRSLVFYLNYAKARIHLNINKWDFHANQSDQKPIALFIALCLPGVLW